MGILAPKLRGGARGRVGWAATSAVVALVGFWVLGPGVGPPKPGLASVQSWGWGLGLKFSRMAWGIIMLMRFSTLVSSSPWSRLTKVKALPCLPILAVRPTRWT